MEYPFSLLRQARQNMIDLIKGLSLEQIHRQPAGFSNHIVWNAGHVVATQQLLTYGLTGHHFRVDQALIDGYRKGTVPGEPLDQARLDQLLQWMLETPEWLEEDYQAGLFKTFHPYTTSFGTRLYSIEEAIQFITVHEGIHLGYMMAIRRAL